jgi:ferritin-like metal-binding protein YciE
MKSKTKSPAGKKSAASKTGGLNDGSKLHKLLVDELKDIYWAEKALTKAIPKMIKNASSEELIAALEEHLTETEEQVAKVEEVFEILGEKAQAKKCEAMEGLIKEAEELMSDNEEGVIRDAAIISAGQKVEHYEIASYGTLVAFANTLGYTDAAEILEEILEEEKNADMKLTEVAETAVNIEAAEEDEEEEEE